MPRPSQGVDAKLKWCPGCHKDRPKAAFYSNASQWDGFSSYCQDCTRQLAREAYRRNPVGVRIQQREAKYGLCEKKFAGLLHAQRGRCAVCRRKFSDLPSVKQYNIYVDHDHRTGRVRGLLCCACNTGIGKLGDTIKGLERALHYLKKQETQ